VILSPLTLIAILFLFALATTSTVYSIMWFRITRTTHLESQIATSVNAIDTTRLKSHLQTMSISAVEIDEEVAALKKDIIKAAHKHHLTLDREETQPESPFDTQKRTALLKIVEKQKSDVAVKVS